MNYRYIKVNGSMLWGVNEINKDILVGCQTGMYDTVIDTKYGTQYDADQNKWVEIKGDV